MVVFIAAGNVVLWLVDPLAPLDLVVVPLVAIPILVGPALDVGLRSGVLGADHAPILAILRLRDIIRATRVFRTDV